PPQLMPVGFDVTVPVPLFETVSVRGMMSNVAVTLRAWSIVTSQVVLASEQLASDHPPNVLVPLVGAAVSVTTVLCTYDCEQSPGQLMPDGFDVTVPVPVPFVPTESVWDTRVNSAVTLRAAVIDTVQPPVPSQAPLQPVNALVAE